MNWDAIGAIGEFVGGVVVIVTIVYLALQLRHSNQQAQASAELQWTRDLNELWDRWSRQEVIEVIRSGFDDFHALAPDQQAVFQMQVGSIVNHLTTGRRLAERGLLPKAFGDTVEDLLVAILSTKGGMQYWEYDAKGTPEGDDIMRRVQSPQRPTPKFDELFPWWGT